MMLKRELTPQDNSRPDGPRRRTRTGTAVFAAVAAVAMLGVGTAAAALAGVAGRSAAPTGTCHPLPAPPYTPPPSPSPSASPTATSTGSMTVTQLCTSVQAVSGSVQAGHTATFLVNVWATGGPANNVSVQIADQPSSFGTAAFSVCGSGSGTGTCTLGTVPVNQTVAMQAQVAVPSKSSAGTGALPDTATGTATGASTSGSVSSSASYTVTAAPPPSSPPPPHKSGHGHGHSSGGSHSGGSGSGSGSGSQVGTNAGLDHIAGLGGLLPLINSNVGSGSVTGANPGNLFPTISPSSGAPGSGPASRSHGPYRPRNVADVLPLNSSQINSQIIGLVVLGIGVVIAVARVSLRKPRAQAK